MTTFMNTCSSQWQNILKDDLPGDYKPIRWELHQDYDCDFGHTFKKIKDLCYPEDELIEDKLNVRFSNAKKPRMISHANFEELLLMEDPDNLEEDGSPSLLHDPLNALSTNTIQGLLVVEGGVLKEDSHHPGMGFCVQRTELLDQISTITKDLMKENKLNLPKSCVKICGAHSYQVIIALYNSTYDLLREFIYFTHLHIYF